MQATSATATVPKPATPNLAGVRVIEIGTAVAIPLVGAVLAHLGADVIKVESQAKLDGNRARIPRTNGGEPRKGLDDSFPLLHEFNTGKSSVALNLKSDAARTLFLRLIEKSDGFIQNFAPGWLERLDLGPQRLLEHNPRLIMLFASGYGQEGPKRDQRVYAPVMTAMGGLEGLIGSEAGEVAGMVATAWGDFNSSYLSVFGFLSALYRREATGQGGVIDLSQVEGVVTTLGAAIAEMQLSGETPGPRGNRSPSAAPRGAYPCRGDDLWIAISITSDEQWRALVDVARYHPSPETSALQSPKWETHEARVADQSEIDALLAAWTQTSEINDLVAALQARSVPCSPLLRPDELEHHPHFLSRAFLEQINHPSQGRVQVTNTPWLFDGQLPRVTGRSPSLGEDNAQVLGELLGVTGEEVARLEEEGVLA